MKKLSAKELQIFLKSNMGYRRYTFDELYYMYSEILNRDLLISYKLMKRDSFRRRLKEWSSVEGGWLVKEGQQNHLTYYAQEPEVCCKFSALYDKAMKIYQKGNARCSWLR